MNEANILNNIERERERERERDGRETLEKHLEVT